VGAWLKFDDGVKVQAKVASSYISAEQAELNLKTELGHFKSLEETRQAAWEIWNKHLSRILVEGVRKRKQRRFIPVISARVCSHENSMKWMRTAIRIISVRTTELFTRDIYTPIPVSGTLSGRSFR
jgi:hypothetical protein